MYSVKYTDSLAMPWPEYHRCWHVHAPNFPISVYQTRVSEVPLMKVEKYPWWDILDRACLLTAEDPCAKGSVSNEILVPRHRENTEICSEIGTC